MFKLSFLLVSVSVLVIFAMMVDKIDAGDCTGSVCGCYKGYCWAYASASSTNPGDWWCYTQLKDIQGKRSLWQSCSGDSDCFWDRTCGNCIQHKGEETEKRTVC